MSHLKIEFMAKCYIRVSPVQKLTGVTQFSPYLLEFLQVGVALPGGGSRTLRKMRSLPAPLFPRFSFLRGCRHLPTCFVLFCSFLATGCSLSYVNAPSKIFADTGNYLIVARPDGGSFSSCSITPTLPDGMHIDERTCNIAGTPDLISPPRTYTVVAQDALGPSSTNVSFEVTCPTIRYGGSPFMLTRLYDKLVAPVTTADGRNPDITACEVSSTLPKGLHFNTQTCEIEGPHFGQMLLLHG